MVREVLRTTHFLWSLVVNCMRQSERMCGSKNRTFSLLCCGRWYYARGRELEVPRTSRSPPVAYCVWCCSVADSMWQAENVRFLEPHILSAVLLETVHDRQRMCGSSSRTFSLLFCGRWYAIGTEREVSSWCLTVVSCHLSSNLWFVKPHILSTPVANRVFCNRENIWLLEPCYSWALPSHIQGSSNHRFSQLQRLTITS